MSNRHDCEEMRRMNEHLARFNTVIEMPFIGPQRVLVSTHKLNMAERGKPKSAFASYCPFCGEKYEELPK